MVSKVNGVALIQVLLLTSALILFAIQYTHSSAEHVKTTSVALDKLAAYIKHRSVQSNMLYSLLTQPKSRFDMQYTDLDFNSQNWNFYGQSFQLEEGVSVSLQDINGLLSIYGNLNNRVLARQLIRLGKSEDEARAIVERLNQWQGNQVRFDFSEIRDDVRGNLVSSNNELKLIEGVDADTLASLSEIITPFPVTLSNPFNAPEKLLWRWIDEEKVLEHVLERRRQGTLTQVDFARLTNIIEDDLVTFQAGRRVVVKINVAVGDANIRSSNVYYVRPENNQPLLSFQ